MTDIELDLALALAIGWKEDDLIEAQTRVLACDYEENQDSPYCWRTFSHLDWNVIGPIAERYDCFPVSDISMWWVPRCARHSLGGLGTLASTPQRAIAMAVIQGAKK